MKWALAIIVIYVAGVAGFFTLGTPIWPFMGLACAVAALKNWRVALLLFTTVVAFQLIKMTVDPMHVWAWYATTFFALGVYSLAFFDKTVIAPAAMVIAALYGLEYFNQPRAVLDVGTEFAFLFALIVGVLRGPSGGIFSKAFGPAGESTHGGRIRVGGLRDFSGVPVRRRGLMGYFQSSRVASEDSG